MLFEFCCNFVECWLVCFIFFDNVVILWFELFMVVKFCLVSCCELLVLWDEFCVILVILWFVIFILCIVFIIDLDV